MTVCLINLFLWLSQAHAHTHAHTHTHTHTHQCGSVKLKKILVTNVNLNPRQLPL